MVELDPRLQLYTAANETITRLEREFNASELAERYVAVWLSSDMPPTIGRFQHQPD